MDLPYVSVCTGIGLLDLAVTRVFRGARPVSLVEREAFCIEHLAQKMEEGVLAPSPICTDVRELRGGDLPDVDLLFGGIPCQPHSQAGKRGGHRDERDLVDEFLRLTGELEPSLVIVENVQGFVGPGGLGRLLGPLADLGFHAEWGTLRASDVGAPHRRRRVFVLAYRHGRGLQVLRSLRVLDGQRETLGDHVDGLSEAVGHPGCDSLQRRGGTGDLRGQEGSGESQGDQRERDGDTASHAVQAVGHPDHQRPQGRLRHDDPSQWLPWPPGPEGDWSGVSEEALPTEPILRGVADGSSIRVDQLRALGNSVVPLQAELAIRRLVARALDKQRLEED